jgi:hypothetical protein
MALFLDQTMYLSVVSNGKMVTEHMTEKLIYCTDIRLKVLRKTTNSFRHAIRSPEGTWTRDLQITKQGCHLLDGRNLANFKTSALSARSSTTEIVVHQFGTCMFHVSVTSIIWRWRFAANQFVLATNPLRITTRIFFQRNTCAHDPYVASSLTRWWVCCLQLQLVLASAVILAFDSLETYDHILLSHIRYSLNLEDQVPVFISPTKSVARLYPQHWVPFSLFPTTRRATVDIFDSTSTRGLKIRYYENYI